MNPATDAEAGAVEAVEAVAVSEEESQVGFGVGLVAATSKIDDSRHASLRTLVFHHIYCGLFAFSIGDTGTLSARFFFIHTPFLSFLLVSWTDAIICLVAGFPWGFFRSVYIVSVSFQYNGRPTT